MFDAKTAQKHTFIFILSGDANMKRAILFLVLLSISFAIVPGQQDSPQPRIISCEGHRLLDQVVYDVTFVNDGDVSSNFHIDDKFSGNVQPGEEESLSISYSLPFDQHTHSVGIDLCVGGYLSYERCASETCTYSESESPETDTSELEALFDTSKLEEACAPAFILLALGTALFFRSV